MSTQSGINPPMGVPYLTPYPTTKEGGVQSGQYIIENMNTATMMQMYNDSISMWKNAAAFGTDLMTLMVKKAKFDHENWVTRRKLDLVAEKNRATDPERIEDMRKKEALEDLESIDRPFTGNVELGSIQQITDHFWSEDEARRSIKAKAEESMNSSRAQRIQDEDTERAEEMARYEANNIIDPRYEGYDENFDQSYYRNLQKQKDTVKAYEEWTRDQQLEDLVQPWWTWGGGY